MTQRELTDEDRDRIVAAIKRPVQTLNATEAELLMCFAAFDVITALCKVRGYNVNEVREHVSECFERYLKGIPYTPLEKH